MSLFSVRPTLHDQTILRSGRKRSRWLGSIFNAWVIQILSMRSPLVLSAERLLLSTGVKLRPRLSTRTAGLRKVTCPGTSAIVLPSRYE